MNAIAPLERRHLLLIYARARRHLHSAHAFQKLARAARQKRVPDAGAARYAQERLGWFREDFKAARAFRRDLEHEARLESTGLFVRIEPYVKAIAFRPLLLREAT